MSNPQRIIKMDTQNNHQLIKVEEFSNIMQSAPAILQRNQTSVSACNQAGQALLDTIEAAGGINSDELDTSVAEYLAKTKITVDNMIKRRKVLTQLLTNVSKSFTSLEAAIDVKSSSTIPYRLQQARNKYAAKKLEEQKRREEEARIKQMQENEKAQYRSDISLLLENTYNDYVNKHITFLNGLVGRCTLSNYDHTVRQITEANTTFIWSDFVQHVKDNFKTFHLTAEIRQGIKNEIASQKRKEFTQRYAFEIGELKQSLIDRFPSLRKQLEEQEVLRQTNLAEATRIEEERKLKAAEEQRKQEEEKRRRDEEARAKAEAEKAAAEVQAAFDFSAANAVSPAPKAKIKKKIQITNPQGFLQVYQMWFTREGINLSMEDLEKVHKKMISYCEKVANKDGEMIQSGFVKYIDDVTAK